MEPAERTPASEAPHWAEQLVRFLDDGLGIPGTRFRIGFDGIVGLLFPGAGDALTATGALALCWLAIQRGAPKAVVARMALNVALDALLGVVPVVGDLFDFAWKANRKNLDLLARQRLREAPRATAGDYLFLALIGLALLAVVVVPLVLAGLLVAWGARNVGAGLHL